MKFFIPVLAFFRRKESQRDKEIDAHCEMVSIRASIQMDAEIKYQVVYDELTDKQKKIVDKHKIKGFVFPTRGDYLDFKRYKCEELLKNKIKDFDKFYKKYLDAYEKDERR